MNLDRVIEQVVPAVVAVQAGDGAGSGFIVDRRGLVITNRHVVRLTSEVIVRLHDSTELRGKVVRSVASTDLAVSFLEGASNLSAVTLGDQAWVKVGQEALALGHPHGLHNTVTRGIVSSVGRLISGTHYLQTDAAINPGNSGGPVINIDGAVIGVATLARTDAQGLGFAIPIEEVRKLLTEMPVVGELVRRRYCPVCGHSNSPDRKYCDTCGTSLEKAERRVPTPGSSGLPASLTVASSVNWSCNACHSTGVQPAPRYCPRCGTSL